MSAVRFTILGQPISLKNSFRVVTIRGHGSLTKTTEAKAYERDFRRQMPPAARVMFEGPVKVTIRAFYTWEGPDLDCALLLDLMQAEYGRLRGKLRALGDGQFAEEIGERVLLSRGVYKNDRQVRDLRLIHGIDKLNPRAEIEVEPLLPQQQDMALVVEAPAKVPF